MDGLSRLSLGKQALYGLAILLCLPIILPYKAWSWARENWREQGLKCGLLLRPGSFWIGAHWSRYNRRICINVVPAVTVWVALPGGVPAAMAASAKQ